MIQVSLQIAVTLALAFLACVFAFGKILLSQFERRMQERFEAQAQQIAGVERKMVEESERLKTLGDRVDQLSHSLPLEYVRREDWIRFSAAIDHKLDRLAELVMSIIAGGARARD